MPPKPKFSKEEVIAAALELVSEKGMSALTSRDLAARLGSSARPIFTVFKNMEEVQQAVQTAAMERFNQYAKKAMQYTPTFKQFGMQMILFAMQEPKLYQLLFMAGDGTVQNFDEIFVQLGENAAVCLTVLQKDYGLNEAEAMELFQHVWIFTFGVGTLCATGVCHFSDEVINELLGQDFMAMLARIKSGASQQPTVHPIQKL